MVNLVRQFYAGDSCFSVRAIGEGGGYVREGDGHAHFYRSFSKNGLNIHEVLDV